MNRVLLDYFGEDVAESLIRLRISSLRARGFSLPLPKNVEYALSAPPDMQTPAQTGQAGARRIRKADAVKIQLGDDSSSIKITWEGA
jgi:hypothetical protein